VIRKNGTRQCLACTKIRYLGYREPAP
jgi:hypothetical protein